ncbi:MAG: carbon monoxide dehydrogenase [Anaerolineales bacterium]|nr:carbon monoxide dehydrogenase [Anaerolineales bacterium]
MKLDGTVTIEAPRQEVWDFLVDINSVSQCVPGLESIEVVVPDEKFKLQASVGLGTVNVKFDAEVEWLDLDPPNRARMKGHGTAPGSAGDATAEMVLTEGPEGTTIMDWTADVMVSGTIASLASRLMGGAAKRLTASFFDCVKDHVES